MVPRNPIIEQRIASLPIAQSERELALEWVNTGHALASMLLTLMQLINPRPAPALKHSH